MRLYYKDVVRWTAVDKTGEVRGVSKRKLIRGKTKRGKNGN